MSPQRSSAQLTVRTTGIPAAFATSGSSSGRLTLSTTWTTSGRRWRRIRAKPAAAGVSTPRTDAAWTAHRAPRGAAQIGTWIRSKRLAGPLNGSGAAQLVAGGVGARHHGDVPAPGAQGLARSPAARVGCRCAPPAADRGRRSRRAARPTAMNRPEGPRESPGGRRRRSAWCGRGGRASAGSSDRGGRVGSAGPGRRLGIVGSVVPRPGAPRNATSRLAAWVVRVDLQLGDEPVAQPPRKRQGRAPSGSGDAAPEQERLVVELHHERTPQRAPPPVGTHHVGDDGRPPRLEAHLGPERDRHLDRRRARRSSAMRSVVEAANARFTPESADPVAGSSVPRTGAFPGSAASTSG